MKELVTAEEMAGALGVSGRRFRGWLREQWRAGHTLLGHHRHNDRWEFSREDAEILMAEFRGSRAGVVPRSEEGSRRPALVPAGGARCADPGHRVTEAWMGEEVETLADLLRPGLRGVVVGINPAPPSIAAGHYYQGRLGQSFFSRLEEVGVLPPGDGFEDDRAFEAGIGFTDVVKRPSVGAGEVSAEELRHGRGLLEDKLEKLEVPRLIFTFKKAAVALLGEFVGNGLLAGARIGGAEVFVMPGPMEKTETTQPTLRRLKAWWENPVA